MPDEIQHVQTVLPLKDLKKLKLLTEESKTKEAVSAAIYYTLARAEDFKKSRNKSEEPNETEMED